MISAAFKGILADSAGDLSSSLRPCTKDDDYSRDVSFEAVVAYHDGRSFVTKRTSRIEQVLNNESKLSVKPSGTCSEPRRGSCESKFVVKQ
jgi:hypothetical protein